VPIFAAGFTPLLILLATAFNKKSHWQLKTFDYVCFAISLFALVLWAATGNPNLAILFAIISEAAATTPTLIKCYKHPKTETFSTYVSALFVAITVFFGITTFSFTSLAFPIYLLISDILLVGFLGRKYYLKTSKH
jgi:hypothetical protein